MSDDVAELRAENERLREALRGLITCHGWSTRRGVKHAECGFLAEAKAALRYHGSDAGASSSPGDESGSPDAPVEDCT